MMITQKTKYIGIILFLVFSISGFKKDNKKSATNTFCNPLNLSYRFQPDLPSRREAADPTVILFKDKYLLFASKSGGYWYSKDLTDWKFVKSDDIPTEDYAPTAIVLNATVYFLASSGKKCTIYKTNDPLSGNWSITVDSLDLPVTDPAFLLDDDGRLYLYWGCSNKNPIYGVELNYKNNFSFIGEPRKLIFANSSSYGWEVPGDYNTIYHVENWYDGTWIEGAWMNKINGKYYLQYAVPGTQFKSYADGLYIANAPLGTFNLAENNPFSYKPEGFIDGAGHSSTFQDKFGNYWHAVTMTISVKHQFERRLGLFPAFYDNDGEFYTYTAFGDFPHAMPDKKMNGPEDYQPDAMLLSYAKPVEVSSALPDHPKQNVTDENIREYWSAESGNQGEWVIVDLLNSCKVKSVQVNFAEEGCNLFSRSDSIYHQYLIEYSNDKKTWEKLVDKTANRTDIPHDFIELQAPVKARYIRLTNYHVPDGKFAISGLRVFGKGNGKLPQNVSSFTAVRDTADARHVTLGWHKSSDATGYNIRYGTKPSKLYLNYQVFDTDTLTINSLNRLQDYYFTIDAFNENGITKGELIQVAEK